MPEQSKTPRRVPRRATEVLEFFVRHPAVADDLEGVTRWRMPAHCLARQVEDTQVALEWLVERGYLRRHASRASSPLFRLEQTRVAAAKRFLARRLRRR